MISWFQIDPKGLIFIISFVSMPKNYVLHFMKPEKILIPVSSFLDCPQMYFFLENARDP